MAIVQRISWIFSAITLFAGLVPAAEVPDTGPAENPGVVLVLSGGGARGAAHIGVLKVLEELRVPVDMVIGTSMGSIVGGLYASGWSPEEIETLLLEIDWAKVFSDRVDRSERTFRRKQDDYPYLIQTKLRFKGFRPYIPPSVLGGQRLDLILRSIEMTSTYETDFDRFPIPYRAVACDLATGNAVIIDHGDLATAMRASMSVPAAFPPVELDGRSLIDGGSAANLPIGIAQDLGAGRVIAIDISSQLDDKGLNSVFGVYGQLSSLLVAGNRDEDAARIREQDLLIVPELGDLSFIDFARAPEAIAIGEQAARANAEALKRYAVSEQEYAAFQKRHHRSAEQSPVIDEVKLLNSSPVADELIQRRLQVEPGVPLDFKKLEKNLIGLYNLDYFGTISDDLKKEDGRLVLEIETPKPRYGRASLQFGLSFANDFDGDSRHAFTARHRLLAVNRHGGEWQNILQTGNTMLFASEFYQPFDYGMAWFGSALVESRETTLPLWSDGERVAEYRTDRNLARIDVGRVLGNWGGELRLGAATSKNRGESQVGAPVYPDLESRLSGLEFGFRVDTLDSVIFPLRGTRLTATYSQGLDELGSDEEYERAFLSYVGAFSWRGFSVAPGLEFGSNFADEVSPFNFFQLGGFGRLSGLGQGELLGSDSVFARVMLYQEITEITISSAKVRVVAGVTLEAGNVFQVDESITWDALRYGGNIFIGADTSAGPVRLGWGYTDGDRTRISFSFGQSF